MGLRARHRPPPAPPPTAPPAPPGSRDPLARDPAPAGVRAGRAGAPGPAGGLRGGSCVPPAGPAPGLPRIVGEGPAAPRNCLARGWALSRVGVCRCGLTSFGGLCFPCAPESPQRAQRRRFLAPVWGRGRWGSPATARMSLCPGALCGAVTSPRSLWKGAADSTEQLRPRRSLRQRRGRPAQGPWQRRRRPGIAHIPCILLLKPQPRLFPGAGSRPDLRPSHPPIR